METARNGVSPEEVYHAVAAVALNILSEDRQQGEAKLLEWENEARPGYILALLEIILQGSSVNEVS